MFSSIKIKFSLRIIWMYVSVCVCMSDTLSSSSMPPHINSRVILKGNLYSFGIKGLSTEDRGWNKVFGYYLY